MPHSTDSSLAFLSNPIFLLQNETYTKLRFSFRNNIENPKKEEQGENSP